MSIDTAIENASASLLMEWFSIDEKSKKLVWMVLENKLTVGEYIAIIKEKALALFPPIKSTTPQKRVFQG